MNRIRIRLDTQSDVLKLVNIASSLDEDIKVYLEDNEGHVANAKSLMGCMYGKVEFKEPYLRSDYMMLSDKFKDFLI